MAKKNAITKKTAIEAANELIQAQKQKDVDNCIKEYNEVTKAIFEKYGCVQGIQGRFVNNQIETQIIITKA